MEVMGAPPPGRDTLSQLRLPPGFRFYPTDEELLVQYLCRKVAGYNFSLQVIGEIDLYKFDPWVLPSKAIFGEKEWYFFSPRDRKYPNGSRPNRVAGSGYWKATGTDKVITTQGRRVGIKKALVFYVGKAPKGTKTNWIMHEYRLVESVARRPNSSSTKLDDWVLCRIYKKTSGGGGARVTDFDTGIPVASSPMNLQQYNNNNNSSGISNSESSSSSHMEEVMESIPEINDDGFFSFPRIITNLKIEPQQFSSPPPQMKFPPPPVVSQPTTTTMHHHHVPPPQPVSAMGAQKQQQQQPLQQEAEDNHNNSKLGLLYSFGSGSIDWNALIGLTSSGPDDLSSLGLGESGISPLQQQSSILTDHDEADMCVPSLPPLCHVGDSPPQHKLSLLTDKRVQIKNDNQEQGQNGWFGGGGYLGNGGGGGQDNPFERRFDCSNQMAGLYGLRQ